MKEISYSTPTTNRGVVNTKNSEFSPEFREKREKSLNNEIKMCVDWCQCTIFSYEKSIYDLYKELFNVDVSYITMELKNLYGYDKCYFYKEKAGCGLSSDYVPSKTRRYEFYQYSEDYKVREKGAWRFLSIE